MVLSHFFKNMFKYIFLRKLNDRKHYFEPQVLKLEDDYEEAAPLTDEEEDEDFDENEDEYESNEMLYSGATKYSNSDEKESISLIEDNRLKTRELSISSSVASSRGDTGYASISEASLSSCTPISEARINSGGSISGAMQHQPVIISSMS